MGRSISVFPCIVQNNFFPDFFNHLPEGVRYDLAFKKCKKSDTKKRKHIYVNKQIEQIEVYLLPEVEVTSEQMLSFSYLVDGYKIARGFTLLCYICLK